MTRWRSEKGGSLQLSGEGAYKFQQIFTNIVDLRFIPSKWNFCSVFTQRMGTCNLETIPNWFNIVQAKLLMEASDNDLVQTVEQANLAFCDFDKEQVVQ